MWEKTRNEKRRLKGDAVPTIFGDKAKAQTITYTEKNVNVFYYLYYVDSHESI